MHKTHILFLAAAALAFTSCGHSHDEHVHGHDHHSHAEEAHEHHHDHEGHEGHNHAGGEITLEPEAAARFGVEVEKIEPGEFCAVVRASGVVTASSTADALVSAPTAGIVRYASGINAGSELGAGAVVATIDAKGMSGGDANAAAKAALDAAKTEYERMEALYADRLATLGERNAALAAYRQAEAAYSPSASAGRATAPVKGVVTTLLTREGQYVEAGEAIATMMTPGEMTLRIDLPQRHASLAPTFIDAVVEFPYSDKALNIKELGGKRLGGATLPAGQGASAYVPVYFSLPKGASTLPGSTFTAYLLGAPRSGVLTVPVEALSEQQGNYFVYEQLDEEGYVKVPVTIGDTDGRRTEIRSGLAPGTPIVVKGTTTVRLAEAGANIPEGHSHVH